VHLDAQRVTLIAAGIAAFSSAATLALNSWLAFDRERRQALIKKEIDRMFAVEELAGRVLELSASYAGVDTRRDRLVALFEELDDAAGRIARYREVQQAVRDLSQTCKLLFHAMQRHEDDRPIRAELNEKHEALMTAIDQIVGRRSGWVDIRRRAI
jgi:hypothetical protein